MFNTVLVSASLIIGFVAGHKGQLVTLAKLAYTLCVDAAAAVRQARAAKGPGK